MENRVKKYSIPDDWTEQDGYITVLFCIPNSFGWRGVVTGLVSSLKLGRTWNETTGRVTEAQAKGLEVFESMAMCDLETQLTRIADSLESINTKVVQRYTYEEFIDDIETAFGIGSILGTLIESILGLMPNLKAKVDFTNLAQSFIETYTRWKPLQIVQTAQAGSQAVIAAAAGTSKILSAASLIFQVLDVVGDGWRQLILGDKNLWDGLIKPIWALFVSDAEGGDGGTDPDNDPTNRVLVMLQQQTNIRLTVNAMCCDAVTSIQDGTPTGTVVTTDSTEIVPGGSIPTSAEGITWIDQTTPSEEKCQAANYIIDWMIAFYGRAEWSQLSGTTSPLTLSSVVTSVLASVPPIGVTLAGLSVWLGQVLAYYGAGNTEILNTIHSKLLTGRDDLVCALYNATDPESAVSAVLDVLAALEVNPLHTWAVEVFLRTNNVVGLLWFDNDLVDYSGGSVDCEGCEPVSEFYYSIDKPGASTEWYPWDGTLTEIAVSGTSDSNGFGFALSFFATDQTTKVCALINNFVKTGIRDSSHWYYTCNGSLVSPAPLVERYVQVQAFFTTVANQAYTITLDAAQQDTWP